MTQVYSTSDRLSTTSDGSQVSGTEYTTGVTRDIYITFAVPSDAPSTLYYYCGNYSGMGGTINIHSDSFAAVVNSVVATAIKVLKMIYNQEELEMYTAKDGVVLEQINQYLLKISKKILR